MSRSLGRRGTIADRLKTPIGQFPPSKGNKMASKEQEKELKELMKETMNFIDKRIGELEKSLLKYADKKLSK
jgi:hypothetical protein